MAINRLTTGERRVHRTAASLAQVLITQSPRVRETIALDRNSFQTTRHFCSTSDQTTQLGVACAAVLQPAPISCQFRGCKAPLSSIVSGAITSELPLPLPFSYRWQTARRI